MSYMFDGCKSLKEIKGLEKWDTNNVTDMSHMFASCQLIKKINLEKFDFFNVRDMSYMFYGCENLKEIQWPLIEAYNVIDIGSMFCGCRNLKKEIIKNFKYSKYKLKEGNDWSKTDCYVKIVHGIDKCEEFCRN